MTPDWLHSVAARGAVRLLEGAGHQALFVGGCVRNTLLQTSVTDLDLSTDALPQQVLALAKVAGVKAIPTGIDHGTVTLIWDGAPVEVTTFRRDVETDGRHATVAFSNRVEEDAARRDFTMNALYMDGRGTVIDPLDGLADLRARHVRFVGDPAQRVAEDYLRILRFFRFTAWYGAPNLGLDAEGLAACAVGAEGLSHVSAERIGAEMLKLLAAPDPAPAVAAMEQTGLLARLLPGADAKALAPLIHLEGAAAPDPIRRLAVLSAADLTTPFRLSKAQARAHNQIATAARDGARPGALGQHLGAELGRNALLVRAALLGQRVSDADLTRVEQGAQAVFPLRAADLMPARQGPALGRALSRLKALWIDSGFTLDRARLLEHLDDHDD